MTDQLRGKSAIVGTGHAGFGEAHGLTSFDVMAQSALAALGDAGLKLSDVDGLFCTMMEDSMPARSWQPNILAFSPASSTVPCRGVVIRELSDIRDHGAGRRFV